MDPTTRCGQGNRDRGNRRLWELHALLPRLGWFDGREGEFRSTITKCSAKCYQAVPDRHAQARPLRRSQRHHRGDQATALGQAEAGGGGVDWQSPDDTNRFKPTNTSNSLTGRNLSGERSAAYLLSLLWMPGGSLELSPIFLMRKSRVTPTSVMRELSCFCMVAICLR